MGVGRCSLPYQWSRFATCHLITSAVFVLNAFVFSFASGHVAAARIIQRVFLASGHALQRVSFCRCTIGTASVSFTFSQTLVVRCPMLGNSGIGGVALGDIGPMRHGRYTFGVRSRPFLNEKK